MKKQTLFNIVIFIMITASLALSTVTFLGLGGTIGNKELGDLSKWTNKEFNNTIGKAEFNEWTTWTSTNMKALFENDELEIAHINRLNGKNGFNQIEMASPSAR